MLLLHLDNTSGGESMESWDVVVVGSGIAALRSAIAASDAGATVAVIESGGPSNAQSKSCSTGIAVSVSESDHINHQNNTSSAGFGLSTPSIVNQRCESALDNLVQLEKWGFNFQRNESSRR